MGKNNQEYDNQNNQKYNNRHDNLLKLTDQLIRITDRINLIQANH